VFDHFTLDPNALTRVDMDSDVEPTTLVSTTFLLPLSATG